MRIANIITVLSLILCASAYSMTEVVDGIQWHFDIVDDGAVISYYGEESSAGGTPRFESPAIDPKITGAITVPSKLGGCDVKRIESSAFRGCSFTSVTLPTSLKSFGYRAFEGCPHLTSVRILDLDSWLGINFGNTSEYNPLYYAHRLFLGDDEVVHLEIPTTCKDIRDYVFAGCTSIESVHVPSSVTNICFGAFRGCPSLKSVSIPASVECISGTAFLECSSLSDVWFEGDVLPTMTGNAVYTHPFLRHAEDFTFHLTKACQSKRRSRLLFGEWVTVDDEGSSNESAVNLTVTNVVVNYVLNSTRPQFAIPLSSDTGFVNVIAEVEGSAISVPESWSESYPLFKTKFGSDFSKAVVMKTGKQGQNGKDMLVWQDYVAGTDPTNPQDVFKAFITIQDGKVTVSYTPELDAERKALRKYTVWGKKSLLDGNWVEVTNQELSGYNFFKVTVEVR